MLVTFTLYGMTGREEVDRGYATTPQAAAAFHFERALIEAGHLTHDCGCCLAKRPEGFRIVKVEP